MSGKEASEQIEHETVNLCNRYTDESDLDDLNIAHAVVKGLNAWLKEELIEFDSDDIDFEED